MVASVSVLLLGRSAGHGPVVGSARLVELARRRGRNREAYLDRLYSVSIGIHIVIDIRMGSWDVVPASPHGRRLT